MTRWNRVGALRRARRLADLSQRQLAERVGVSRATIGRAESADEPVGLDLVEAILAVAGLRLAVLDADGQEVESMRESVEHDGGGRRFPAHLDVEPADDSGRPDGQVWHRGRPVPSATFRHRHHRDHPRRSGVGARPPRPRPQDHLTTGELAAERRRMVDDYWRLVAPLLVEARTAPYDAVTDPDRCTCPIDCESTCLPWCWCQCEPDSLGVRAQPTQPAQPAAPASVSDALSPGQSGDKTAMSDSSQSLHKEVVQNNSDTAP